MEWILIKDELPPEDEIVLFSEQWDNTYFTTEVGQYRNYCGKMEFMDMQDEQPGILIPVAWMKMPIYSPNNH